MDSPRKRKRNEDTISAKASECFILTSEDDALKKMYNCKICNVPINGTKLHNLSLHLRNMHVEKYNEITRQEHISVRRLDLLQNIVEIVSVNGRPFSSIHDSGFQKIIAEKVNSLNEAGYSLHLSDANLPTVKNHLNEMADAVRDKIKQEVCGRALSLMIDIGTKNHRSIFGISVQYIVNGKLKIRSLGMTELLKSHTAKYLADVVQDRLKLYGIDLRQILTITTDNGANVLKMVKDIDAILQTRMEEFTNIQAQPSESPRKPQNPHSSANDESQIDAEIDEILLEMDETTDHDALEELFDDVELNDNESLLTAISIQLVDEFGLNVLYDITGVNCSAHTLQLAIKDAMKRIGRNYSNIIRLCRNAAKLLRLKSQQEIYTAETDAEKYKVPRLDVETRWGYTYLMVRFS